MLGSLPTAAVQTFAGLERARTRATGKPFQLDRCHALETTSETVRRYYPRWYRGARVAPTSDRRRREDPRVPGQGDLSQIRHAGAARHSGVFASTRRSRRREALGGPVWVVKAQIHAGGRGKGGGVKLARSIDEVRDAAPGRSSACNSSRTRPGPRGQKVRRLLIEEGADIKKELYVGMVVDRGSQRVVLMASSEGGMDIEEVAAKTPEKHPQGLHRSGHRADRCARPTTIARKIGIPDAMLPQARAMFAGALPAFDETDASLAEINPLIVTGDGKLIALDAKLNFDANALFRHPDIVAMRDLDEEDPAEIEASKFDLSYISLDGNIGCLVNGAGLAMATMDVIKLYGGSPRTSSTSAAAPPRRR